MCQKFQLNEGLLSFDMTSLNFSNWNTSMIIDLGRAFKLVYSEQSDFLGLISLGLSG